MKTFSSKITQAGESKEMSHQSYSHCMHERSNYSVTRDVEHLVLSYGTFKYKPYTDESREENFILSEFQPIFLKL
jgi:hypothetical protein